VKVATLPTTALARAQAKIDSTVERERPARSYDAADLVALHLPDPSYIVRPYIAEGVILCCGRQKMGKTTLLRQLGFAANTGGEIFGAPVVYADVLFLSLEEGERIMRKKLALLCSNPEQLRGMRFEFEWPQGAEGVQKLRDWLRSRSNERPPLIIIDSLTRFRVPPSDRGHAFTEDYNTVKLLADLCKEFPGLSIVLLHHTTKAIPEDPVSAISGTYGISAAADSYLILLKQGQGFRLHAGGRLWEGDTNDFELKRSDGGWALAGEWDLTAPQGLTPKQQQVVDLLAKGAKSGKTLSDSTGQSASALSHLMGALQDRGLVRRVANGWELTR